MVQFAVVAFTKLCLETLNFVFKNIFVGLVFGFQSKNLVIGFFRKALALVGEVI